ncbi:MAG: peptidoglycan DD-metalloendopeptidase family protein [Acidimicrobiia bacterium]|nr:peptidoglycan DD-metalloendopeptidase family protein [Acidimicrobiia bacterium]MYC45659.1 peptidoglycan DD-metalloendopeptidase family protein [Acidimicrobiia bacterium]
MSRRARLLAACLLVLLPALPARAQDSADHQYLQDRLAGDDQLNRSRAELEQLGAEQGLLGSEIDALQLSTAQVEAELARTADLIALSEARLANIAARQVLTADLHEVAESALQGAEIAFATRRRLANERLVNMYVYSTEHRTALSWQVSDVHDLENRHVLLTMVGEYDKELLEGLDAAVVEIDERRRTLESLQRTIETLAAQEGEVLSEHNRARDLQAELHAELQARVRQLHDEIEALEAAQAEVDAILAARVAEIELEAAERDRRRGICFANPRRPLDGDGSWIDCPAVGVVIPPSAVRWPLVDRVTSEYGPRWGRMHEGIDIAGTHGAPIHSAESGRVDYAGWIRGYGNTIIVDHGGGMSTLYAHMHGFAVAAGQTVSIGQVVGYVGNSGFSQGPHLHFEVRIDGAPVNPRTYLP